VRAAVDACFNAIERALNLKPSLESYMSFGHLREQAMGEVIVRIRTKIKSFTGRRIATDVIEASAKAYTGFKSQQSYLESKENDETLKFIIGVLK